jgi:hypothetical protein
VIIVERLERSGFEKLEEIFASLAGLIVVRVARPA